MYNVPEPVPVKIKYAIINYPSFNNTTKAPGPPLPPTLFPDGPVAPPPLPPLLKLSAFENNIEELAGIDTAPGALPPLPLFPPGVKPFPPFPPLTVKL